MNREFTEAEQGLRANLGIYGDWLIQHGKEVGKDLDNPIARRLISVYSMYHRRPEHCAAGILMGAIDEYCRSTGQRIPSEIPFAERMSIYDSTND